MLKYISGLTGLWLAVIMPQATIAASLKSDVTVYSNLVLAKDLFDDAGKYGHHPLFLAPDLGSSGRISAERVLSEAHDVGIFDISLNGVEVIAVHRPSQKISDNDITAELKREITDRLTSQIDFEIKTTSIPPLTHGDPRVANALTIKDIRLQAENTRFQTVVHIKTPRGETLIPVRGTITEMKKVVTLTRDMERNYILQAGDFEEQRVAVTRVKSGAVLSPEGLIGKAVTRNLNTNAILREQDVTEPLVVRANDPVSITYSVPGLLVTAQGRALDSGPKNAIISVMNLQSRRAIRGRITDKGEILVEPRNSRLASRASPNSQEVQ